MKEKEIIRTMKKITLIKPGGNDTALIAGIDFSAGTRKTINDAIMAKYPNIEQVGFIDLSDPSQPVLEMAGGEFCGNATRSTAFLALNGKPGQVDIKVSGTKKPLRAGVNQACEAWAEMPVPDTIDLKTIDQYTLVPLDGITQVITNLPEDLSSEEEIKQAGIKILKKLNLTDNPEVPASGVMFISQNEGQIKAEPVVWVRDIQTCFYETACGSGTAAVGLFQAISSGQDQITLAIMQPSGMPINVSVNLSSEKPEVIISGPIEVLDKNASVETDAKVKITQIKTLKDINQALASGLIELYQEVFSKEPYNEVFTDQEVIDIFTQYFNQGGLIFVATEKDQVVGFGATIPVTQSNIKDVASENNLPKDAWYMADLGVKDSIRRQGLGEDLVKAGLKLIPPGSFVIMRTARNNLASQSLYLKLGFEKLPFTQLVSQQRTRGEAVDERIFLGKTI